MFIFKRRYKCILCNKYHNKENIQHTYYGIGICDSCLAEIKTGGDKSFQAKAPVDYVLAPFYYDGKMKKAVMNYKFAGQRAYGKIFGELLAAELSESLLSESDCIIPVPLHGTRLDERGYNQSEILAEVLADKLGLPCITDGIFRIKETKRQSSLRGAERVENVRSAFYAADSIIRGKNVILVDDIFTMGETMSSCAKALKAAGAGKIIGVALCKTKLKERPLFYR